MIYEFECGLSAKCLQHLIGFQIRISQSNWKKKLICKQQLTDRWVFVEHSVWKSPNNRYTPKCRNVYRNLCHRTRHISNQDAGPFDCRLSMTTTMIPNCRRHSLCSVLPRAAVDSAVSNMTRAMSGDLKLKKLKWKGNNGKLFKKNNEKNIFMENRR